MLISVIMQLLSKWIDKNKMVLNTDKTEVMLYGTKDKIKRNHDSFSIKLDNKELRTVKSHKLLGLHTDNSLTWDIHIDKLCAKLKSRLFLFNKIKHLLPLQSRICFYDSLVQSIIDYGCTIWGNTSKMNLKRIHKIVKLFGRSILNIKKARDIHIKDLFKRLNWIPINERIQFFKNILVYKCLNGLMPDYIANSLIPVQTIHNINTRQHRRGTLYVPYFRTDAGRKTFSYDASKCWNGLPNYVTDAPSLATFKKRYLLYLNVKLSTDEHFLLDK